MLPPDVFCCDSGINLACKTYPKKSGVDLKTVDNHRCSVLHYLVDSPPRGSFDNHELLIQLDAAGCPLSQYRDVLDLTLKQGLVRLSTTYQYLLDKKCSNFVSYFMFITQGVLYELSPMSHHCETKLRVMIALTNNCNKTCER
jgi:hypothetical protein